MYSDSNNICSDTNNMFRNIWICVQSQTICLWIDQYGFRHKQNVKDIEICVQRQTICLEIDDKGIRHKKYVENIII